MILESLSPAVAVPELIATKTLDPGSSHLAFDPGLGTLGDGNLSYM